MAERPPPAMGPGRRVVYRPDHKGIGEFLMSEQLRDATEDVAGDIAKLAGAFSPHRKGAPAGGDRVPLSESFKVKREAGSIKVHRARRVKVEVYSEAPSAAANEFGGRRNKRHRMLGRAGSAFGDWKGKEDMVP